jgi:hypothetical protein
MSRKNVVEHPDDDHVALAEPVTADELRQLSALGWRGPTPSTAAQASAILERLRAAPAGSAEDRSVRAT